METDMTTGVTMGEDVATIRVVNGEGATRMETGVITIETMTGLATVGTEISEITEAIITNRITGTTWDLMVSS